MKKSGFSLFELLVVISIIGIIVAVGMTSYSSAQKRARDAKRKQDMQAVQKAFEQYYSANNYNYPDDQTKARTNMPGYPPVDPKNTRSYIYEGTGDTEINATGYCICALLEITGTGNSSDVNCSFVSGSTGDYFCVKSVQ